MHHKSPNIVYSAKNGVVDAQLSIQYNFTSGSIANIIENDNYGILSVENPT
jgi:hypothetical protein